MALSLSAAPTAADATSAGLTNRSALEYHDGDFMVTEDGTVVENLEIKGRLMIKGARNVVVRNVWVYTTSDYTIRVWDGGSVLVEDSEIGHPSYVGDRGIAGNNVTARRLDIHHVEDAILVGDDSVYDEVYCHDLTSNNPSPHMDCAQDTGGHDNWIIKRSTLDAGSGNAAL